MSASPNLWFLVHTLSEQLPLSLVGQWRGIRRTWNERGTSEAPAQICKLEIQPWLACRQSSPLMCDSTHPSSRVIIRSQRSDNSFRTRAWLLTCQTCIIKNSRAKERWEKGQRLLCSVCEGSSERKVILRSTAL